MNKSTSLSDICFICLKSTTSNTLPPPRPLLTKTGRRRKTKVPDTTKNVRNSSPKILLSYLLKSRPVKDNEASQTEILKACESGKFKMCGECSDSSKSISKLHLELEAVQMRMIEVLRNLQSMIRGTDCSGRIGNFEGPLKQETEADVKLFRLLSKFQLHLKQFSAQKLTDGCHIPLTRLRSCGFSTKLPNLQMAPQVSTDNCDNREARDRLEESQSEPWDTRRINMDPILKSIEDVKCTPTWNSLECENALPHSPQNLFDDDSNVDLDPDDSLSSNVAADAAEKNNCLGAQDEDGKTRIGRRILKGKGVNRKPKLPKPMVKAIAVKKGKSKSRVVRAAAKQSRSQPTEFTSTLPPIKIEDPGLLQESLDTRGDATLPSTSPTMKKYFCSMCPGSFRLKSNLDRHIFAVHAAEVKPLPCPQCHKTFLTASRLQAHQRKSCQGGSASNNRKKPPSTTTWNCDICFEKITKASANSHLESHPQFEKLYSCDICVTPQVWGTFKGYVWHLIQRGCSSGGQMPCNFCDAKMTKLKLCRHLYEHHNVDHPKLPCSYETCPSTFFDPKSKSLHIRIEHERQHVCPICHLSLRGAIDLERHQEMKHPAEGQLHQCAHCIKTFNNLETLKTHETNMHISPLEMASCEFCGKSMTKYNLHQHVEVVHEKRLKHFCQFCGKGFCLRTKLGIHEEAHLGVKKYKCDLCDYAGATKGNLTKHRLNHGEKKWECQYCQKRFAVKRYLKDHVRSHTKETPFACNECGVAFSQKCTLLLHRKKKHGLEPAKWRLDVFENV